MLEQECTLKDGRILRIRKGKPDDAGALLDYVERVSGESDFLTFGLGEFELSEAEEAAFLRACSDSNGRIYLLGLVDEEIVGTLNFATGKRRRTRHSGEFGMSVRKDHWGLGIGSFLLDVLLDWIRQGEEVTKINLRVRTDNVRAIALYERKGFRIEGTVRREIRIDGEYFDHHWMGLEL